MIKILLLYYSMAFNFMIFSVFLPGKKEKTSLSYFIVDLIARTGRRSNYRTI
jgi:hypothetical protein